MIALDALEQLNSQAFQLIAADARGCSVPCRIEIVIEKAIRERAHRQMRGIDVFEYHRAARHNRHGGMQRVGLAAQGQELFVRPGAVGRLGKPPVAQRERLIGAEHHAIGMLGRHRLGLLPRQQRRDHPRILKARSGFDGTLVDVGGLDLDRDAGALQQRAPGRALGGEHQRTRSEPQRTHLCSILN